MKTAHLNLFLLFLFFTMVLCNTVPHEVSSVGFKPSTSLIKKRDCLLETVNQASP